MIESGVRHPKDHLDATIAEKYRNLDTALSDGESYVSQLNVSSLEELRNLDYTPFSDGIIGTALDSYAMPDAYANILASHAANNVLILTVSSRVAIIN